MNPKAVQKYLALMDEIKRRTSVIDGFANGLIHARYKATTIESIYLQFRKILELIAMGSMVANKDAFSRAYKRFAKCWNAEYLINDIQQINHDFYPKPIIQRPSDKPGIKMQWTDRGPDYLTKKDLIKLYKKCGGIMHSGNPYGSQIDYGYYETGIGEWSTKIINLLTSHEIRLINDENIYLIQMGATDSTPTYTVFAPMTQKETEERGLNSR